MPENHEDPFKKGTTQYQLNLIYLVDTSGSMIGEPINQLNAAMSEAVTVAEEAANEKEVQLFMRVVEFNSSADWIFGDTENGLGHIDWVPRSANGGTDTAGAIDKATSVMHRKYLGERNFRPVVILITDGQSNDPTATVEAVEKLKSSLKSSSDPTKDKIIRMAIGVKDANQTELTNFASLGNIERPDGTVDENVPLVFNVDDVALLKGLLRGVTVSSIASSVGGGPVDEETGNNNGGILLPDPGQGGDDWEV